MAFHDGSTSLGFSRFLSCEDYTWERGLHSVRNPLATISSVFILACPLHATVAWSTHARRAAPWFVAPLWLLFLHNLYHHATGPPCVDIEGFASVLLANSVRMFSGAAPGLGLAVGGAVAAAAASDCGRGTEYQLALNNALTGFFPLVITALVVRRGASESRADEVYLLKKLWVFAVLLAVTGLAIEPNFCDAPGMNWWHPTIVHFTITCFFLCFSNLVLVAAGSPPGRCAVGRRLFYDAIVPRRGKMS